MSTYPALRMRRLRRHDWTRRLVAENTLSPADFIWPVFVIEGDNKREAVSSMPGVERLSVDLVVKAAKEAASLGIPVIALFPQTPAGLKTEEGSEAVNPDNLVCRAVRAIKSAVPEIGVLCDVALDPYTSHGHDGVLRDGDVHNDATIELLVQQSLVQVRAGCDIIAPSDMMDGRIGAIRAALEKAGHHNVLLMAYAAKYASAFYGPFRDAVGSAKSQSLQGLAAGDKRTYQMDPANGDE
ncbi:MAG TPA: porphobilinogen synthase, partial [Rhizomicrobium sp.]|nr:porphobilinogen synthase [Rhizomicrobium sp.]